MRRRVLTVAQVARASMRARDPYLLGDKVLLVRLASLLEMPVASLGRRLLEMQDEGLLSLTRIDLRQAFDGMRKALERSRIEGNGVYYDAIDRGQFG